MSEKSGVERCLVGLVVSCVVCHHCKTLGSLGRWAWLDPVQPALPSRTCPSPCNTIRTSTTGEMEYRELDYNLSTGVLTQTGSSVSEY